MRTRWIKTVLIAPVVVALVAALTVNAAAYDDVPEGTYYSDAVAWLDAQEISEGTSDTDFSPERGVTRVEFIVLLWRMAGSPTPSGGAHTFTDAPGGGQFRTATEWAFGTTIAVGRTSDVLDPGAVITRSEALAILWRYMCRPTGAAPHGFTDVLSGTYYDTAAAWAKAAGVVFGRTPTSLDPDTTLTRADAAAMLWRLAGRPAPNGAGDNRTTDAPTCGGGVSDVPVNNAPVLDDIADQIVEPDSKVHVEAKASDVDGDELSFSLTGRVPEGASITDDGAFSWSPDFGGEFTFIVLVTDDGKPPLSDETSFRVVVAEPDPCLALLVTLVDPCDPCFLETSDIGHSGCDPCYLALRGENPPPPPAACEG